jgi:hypothetical protein
LKNVSPDFGRSVPSEVKSDYSQENLLYFPSCADNPEVSEEDPSIGRAAGTIPPSDTSLEVEKESKIMYTVGYDIATSFIVLVDVNGFALPRWGGERQLRQVP